MKASPLIKIARRGAIIVGGLFVLGIGVLIYANAKFGSNTTSFRDTGVVFGATIAAAGAIAAAFIAFQGSRDLEEKKDLQERLRRIDDERTKAEAAIVTLHVMATFIDGLHSQIGEVNGMVENALKKKSYSEFCRAVVTMPSVPNPFPLIRDLDVRFMRLAEQKNIRGIEVCLELLGNALKALESDSQLSKTAQDQFLALLGEEGFFDMLQHASKQVGQFNQKLFDAAFTYINQRKPSTIPDESKLSMLLGDLKGENKGPIDTLDEARESIRNLASYLLNNKVDPAEVRRLMQSVAESVEVQDSVTKS